MIPKISIAQPISLRNNKQRTNHYQSQVAFCANNLSIDLYTHKELLDVIINGVQLNNSIRFIKQETSKSGNTLSIFKGFIGTIKTNVEDMASPIIFKSEGKSVEINNNVASQEYKKTFETAKTVLKNIIPQ